MSDPIAFPSLTQSLGLPLLIAGQAQKEFFVNQALCILDALYLRAVLASQAAPPATANEGDCYRVTAPAVLGWAGHEDAIAVHIAGEWHFVAPKSGMQVFDTGAGHALVYRTNWERADAPASPSGGTVIDTEARAAIVQLIQSLLAIGVLSTA